MVKVFDKSYLVNELDLPWSAEEDRVIDTRRWSTDHEIVFKDNDGKFYQTCYSIGSTEIQDEKPWEYEDQVKCVEVVRKPVTVMKWVPVEE